MADRMSDPTEWVVTPRPLVETPDWNESFPGADQLGRTESGPLPGPDTQASPYGDINEPPDPRSWKSSDYHE